MYLIYDEFGNSFLPGFDTLITTTRKYRMSFLLLMQGQQQLITKYGKDLMHVIMSGIATQISFGAAEHVTASFFEQKAGNSRLITPSPTFGHSCAFRGDPAIDSDSIRPPVPI